MELKKWKSNSGTAINLICTPEEYTMLREFLENHGVNLSTSAWSDKECTAYARNVYREVVNLWGSDLCKKLGAEFFDDYKRGRG